MNDPDLVELDRIWPLGQQLTVPDDGTIIVAGAYEGRYMRYFRNRFPNASIHGFEPQKLISQRVHRYGLATNNRMATLGLCNTDGASVCTSKGTIGTVKMRDIVEVIYDIGDIIDLALFNMEGSEWSVLPYLLDEMMHHRIVSMAIQFHPEYVSKSRAERVLSYMDEYYDRKYWDYPTWTYWVRK